MDNTFAKNLSHLRQKKGLSQNKMAKELGVSPQRYNSWEAGKVWPKISILVALSTALQFTDLYSLLTKDISNEESNRVE